MDDEINYLNWLGWQLSQCEEDDDEWDALIVEYAIYKDIQK